MEGGGDNWSYKMYKASPPTNQHPTVYSQMPFLSPNQQCQSTEGKLSVIPQSKAYQFTLTASTANELLNLVQWGVSNRFPRGLQNPR